MSKTGQAGRPSGRLAPHYTPVRGMGGLAAVRGGRSGGGRAPFGVERGAFIGGEITLSARERACHPGRREAAIRDGGANPMSVPEAASAAIRGKGEEDALVAALLPAQPCGLSGRETLSAVPSPLFASLRRG